MHTEIIEYIRRNRVSTTEVADCLDKSGALTQVQPLNRGHFRVGSVFWAYGWAESNWPIHERIQNVPKDCLVVVSAIECQDRALLGDLVAKYLLLYRQVQAIVVIGNVRDTPRLIKENWPIWCSGSNPIGCFNHKPIHDLSTDQKAIGLRFEEAIAVCDDCGVVVIEKKFQTKELLLKLEQIEEQEDIWYDCIDRRKWTTFDTICQKKYLTDAH